MKQMSVKKKITLWYTVFMTGFVLASLFLVLFLANGRMLSDAKTHLKDTVLRSFLEIDYEEGALEFDDDINYLGEGIYLSVYNSEGALIYGRIPASFDGAFVLIKDTLQQVHSSGQQWFVYDSCQDISGYGTVWVRGILSPSFSDSSLRTVVFCALILSPFFIILTAAGGYSIIRRALMPLQKMTETAEHISTGEDLSRRLDIPPGADEVHRLAHTFDGMMDRLQTSFESEKQFNSDVSHELRTPLSVILSQSEYALEETSSDAERTQALSVIRSQAKRMSALISQLLTLARAESSRLALHPEPLDLSILAELVCEGHAEAAKKRGITIFTDLPEGLFITADETLMIRFFDNLIANAVTYGKEGGNICVSLSDDKTFISGSVRDNGIGIPPESLDKIWNRFYQVEPSRTESACNEGHGCGLGLSMVRWIVKAHGGQIQVSSAVGKGTEFTFSFPKKFLKNEKL